MDFLALAGLYGIIFPIIGFCLLLLLLYGVIRVAVARGLRDHQMWMEHTRRAEGIVPAGRTTVGQYLGLSRAPSAPTETGAPSARD